MNTKHKHLTKQVKFNILKSVALMLVCIFIASIFSIIFTPKSNDSKSGITNYVARGFYGERKNSLDIIGIGDSDLACGYSPMDMWEQYGYTGFNCSEPDQTIFEAYNMLREVMTCQKPKVVILEVDGLFQTGSYVSTVCKLFDTKLKWAFPIFEYHNRWKNINKDDFTKCPLFSYTNIDKGYWYSKNMKSMAVKPQRTFSKKRDCINAINLIQLDTFRNLCKKNGAQLLLVYIPSANTWNQHQHDSVAKYAEKHDVPFLDLNTCTDDFHLDWKTDSWDGGTHLNCFGAKKTTEYLAKYLSKHYSMPSHKDDKEFIQWDLDYNYNVSIRS